MGGESYIYISLFEGEVQRGKPVAIAPLGTVVTYMPWLPGDIVTGSRTLRKASMLYQP
jgi:hypothetical protein